MYGLINWLKIIKLSTAEKFINLAWGQESLILSLFLIQCSPSSYHGLPWWLRPYSVCIQRGRPGFDPWVSKIPWRRTWQPTPVLLPGKSHRQRSVVGYSPWGCKESDMTEWLHFLSFFSLSSYHNQECLFLQQVEEKSSHCIPGF